MASALPADPIGRAVAFTFCNVVAETTEILIAGFWQAIEQRAFADSDIGQG